MIMEPRKEKEKNNRKCHHIRWFIADQLKENEIWNIWNFWLTEIASPYTVINKSLLSSGSLPTSNEHLGLAERFCTKESVYNHLTSWKLQSPIREIQEMHLIKKSTNTWGFDLKNRLSSKKKTTRVHGDGIWFWQLPLIPVSSKILSSFLQETKIQFKLKSGYMTSVNQEGDILGSRVYRFPHHVSYFVKPHTFDRKTY